MIDIHTHILPGIDDGARTLLESVEIVRGLYQQGVTDIVATPHYIEETIYASPRANNLNLILELRQRLMFEGIKVKIYLGNEIYINRRIVDLIKEKKISTLANSKYLLVELPMNEEYPDYEDFLKDLMDHGYKVILAHPERYTIVQQDYGVIQELFEMGVLLQCNIGSVIGKYSKDAQKVVKRLIKDKMIFTFSSDIHRPGGIEKFALAKKKLSKYYNRSELEQLLVKNPSQILSK
ncbi:hypothetical protein IKG29_01715 [Candidatus Saccharibacteria bacterium]|nr:hypothetical protein [Candidatus Saccharibacteria bacterium]